MGKKLTQEEVEKYYLEHGYELLSEYKNANTKDRVKSHKTGNVYKITLHAFKKGKRPYAEHERKPYKTQKEFYKQFKHLFGDEYTLLSSYKGVHDDISARHNKCGLVSTKKANNWVNNHSGCKLCSHGSSKGERIIYKILQQSKYKFEYSKRVRVNGHIREFDFYLPSLNLYIEYDGEQHTINRNSWYRGSQIDKEKDNYVSSTGRSIVRVPYTAKTPKEIVYYLIDKGITNIAYHEEIDYLEYIYDRVAISDYFSNHTIEKTKDKFGVSMQTVLRCYSLCHEGRHKVWKSLQEKEKIVRYYLTHTVKETTKVYPYDSSMIRLYFKQVYGMTKTEYLKQHSDLKS